MDSSSLRTRIHRKKLKTVTILAENSLALPEIEFVGQNNLGVIQRAGLPDQAGLIAVSSITGMSQINQITTRGILGQGCPGTTARSMGCQYMIQAGVNRFAENQTRKAGNSEETDLSIGIENDVCVPGEVIGKDHGETVGYGAKGPCT